MCALSTAYFHVEPEPTRPASAADHQVHVVFGPLLILLLAFATSTVFIQPAWAIQSFQIGIYLLVVAYLAWGARRSNLIVEAGVAPSLVYLIPLWGVLQIVAHTTVSSIETREAALRWGSLAGVFFLAQVVARNNAGRRILLNGFLCFATAMAILCLLQLFSSKGHVLWIFASGYPDVYATFPYYNNYAQFVELALPIALWQALREGWRCWWYGLSGGILYASVIGAASRAGACLCTVELIVILAIGLLKLRESRTGLLSRSTATILIAVPILAAIFTVVVGWEHVWGRFKENDPYLVRREFISSAIDMAKQRPLTGFGLGTFPEVYQRYAIKDFPFYANHAHNDWAEFAADGGVPFLLLVLIPFATIVPTAFRHPWGLGLVAVMLHACIDFPFPRPAVSGWMFAMLGALYIARTSDATLGNQNQKTNVSKPN